MAAVSSADLKFGSSLNGDGVIADINSLGGSPAIGDVYNRVNSGNRPMLDVSRVTFPGTKGAELRVIGNQQSAANSLVIRYGVSNGKPSFIFKGLGDMQGFLDTIDTYRLVEANLIDTLSDSYVSGGLTGMYWSKFSTSDIFIVTTREGDRDCVFFEAEFIRITAP